MPSKAKSPPAQHTVRGVRRVFFLGLGVPQYGPLAPLAKKSLQLWNANFINKIHRNRVAERVGASLACRNPGAFRMTLYQDPEPLPADLEDRLPGFGFRSISNQEQPLIQERIGVLHKRMNAQFATLLALDVKPSVGHVFTGKAFFPVSSDTLRPGL